MKRTIFLLVFLLLPTVGLTYFGGSNLGVFGYPDHSCDKPVKPFEFDQFMLDLYRIERHQYIRCINTYIENANNDIRRIRDKAEEAYNEARR